MIEQKPMETATASPAPAPDPAAREMALERLRAEQSLPAGLMAGLAASLVGAAVWAVLTAVTEFQIGWMAVGVGFLVGFSVRLAGRGLDQVFGVAGSVLSLLGCVAGNLLAVVVMLSKQEALPFIEIMSRLDVSAAAQLLTATFNPIDLVFYGIALYEGYRLSFRQVTEADIAQALAGARG